MIAVFNPIVVGHSSRTFERVGGESYLQPCMRAAEAEHLSSLAYEQQTQFREGRYYFGRQE